MSDIINHGVGPHGSNERDRRAADRPDSSPVGQVKGRLTQIDERLADFERRVAETFNATDQEIATLLDAMSATMVIVGALIQAVNALAADPNNPNAAAAQAREIMQEVTSEPEPQPTGDGVVREPKGDPS